MGGSSGKQALCWQFSCQVHVKLPVLAGSFSLAWCDDIRAWRVRIYLHIIAASAVIPHHLLVVLLPGIGCSLSFYSALPWPARHLCCHLCFFLRSLPASLPKYCYLSPLATLLVASHMQVECQKQHRESRNPLI